MKRLLLIATGGTISCDFKKNGLTPAIESDVLIQSIQKEIDSEIVGIQLLNIDSANISPTNWMMIAEVVQDNYAFYDGFVISHGTDTLAFTAAAISYLIQNSTKPIVITGSQKPIHHLNSDACDNLSDSLKVAESGRGGVFVVFDHKIIYGTQAKKVHSLDNHAFITLNRPYAGFIIEGCVQWMDSQDITIQLSINLKPSFFKVLNQSVIIIKLFPGLSPQLIYMLSKGYKGIVIESFGVGSIPQTSEPTINDTFITLAGEGKIIVIATQMLYGGTHMHLYETGRLTLETGAVIEGKGLSSESAFAKLMWVLSLTSSFEKAKTLMHQEIEKDQIGETYDKI